MHPLARLIEIRGFNVEFRSVLNHIVAVIHAAVMVRTGRPHRNQVTTFHQVQRIDGKIQITIPGRQLRDFKAGGRSPEGRDQRTEPSP